jgi:4-hydroxyphenylacetate 3-monooxygenase
VFGSTFYPIVKNLIEQTLASSMIYLNSSAVDFKSPELRPYLEKYVRGSNGYSAEDRIKLMKLLWDSIGSEFGSRHELYEINYAGSTEENRLIALNVASASGLSDRMKGLADTCMAEYDIDGWTVPDLINPVDVNYVLAQLNK